MACTRPLVARIDNGIGSKHVKILGRYQGLIPPDGVGFRHVLLPCGHCLHCRLRRSLEWTIRNYHEYQTSGVASFLTLTYNDSNLRFPPASDLATLYYPDVQKFLKRFRKWLSVSFPEVKIKYFLCGEYGSRYGRPHYHLILYGFQFPDLVVSRRLKNYTLYRSPTLERLWPHGFSLVGAVCPSSISYVCRYNLKKQVGLQAVDWYQGRTPEFVHMSLKPAIGSDWLSLFSGDVYKVDRLTEQVYQDAVRYQGRLNRPPRYYDTLIGRADSELWSIIRSDRERRVAAVGSPDVLDLERSERYSEYVAFQRQRERALSDRAEPHLLHH